MVTEQRRFPIGKWIKPESISEDQIKRWIDEIDYIPSVLAGLIRNLNSDQEQYCYRKDGWNIKQLVHHMGDSHMNAYIRQKLALSSDQPTINPYDENAWAQMADVVEVDLATALTLLQALHKRWTVFLRSLKKEDFARGFYHPGHGRLILLDESLGMYAWHCKHHTEHIKIALATEGKTES